MRRHLLTFILLTLLPCILFAQAVPANEDELKPLLCYKWIVTKMELGDITLNVPAKQNAYFVFKKDNTVTVSTSGSPFEQHWSYDGATKTISLKEPTTGNRKDYFAISEISDSTMVIAADSKALKTKTFLTRSN